MAEFDPHNTISYHYFRENFGEHPLGASCMFGQPFYGKSISPLIKRPTHENHLLPYQVTNGAKEEPELFATIRLSKPELVAIDPVRTPRMAALMSSRDRRKRKRGQRLYYAALAASLGLTPSALKRRYDAMRREMASRIDAEIWKIITGGVTPFGGNEEK